MPAVRVTLTGASLDELIVSTGDAEAVAGAVRARAGLADGDRNDPRAAREKLG